MSSARRLQAIIFDFDGVIANSEPMHLRAFQETLAEDGIPLSAEDYYAKYLGYDDVGMFEALARNLGRPLTTRQIASLLERKGARMGR